MTTRACRLSLWCWLTASACLAAEPEPATAILLRVDATREVRASATQLRIRSAVQLAPDAQWVDRGAISVDVRARESWPVDIPVTPRDVRDFPHAFQITVEATGGSSFTVAGARAITWFIRGSQRLLRITLARCAEQAPGAACEPDPECNGTACLTCNGQICETTAVTQPSELEVVDPARLDTRPERAPEPELPAIDAGMDETGTTGILAVTWTPHAAARNPTGAPTTGGGAAGSGQPLPPPTTSDPGPMAPPPVSPLSWATPALLETEAVDVLRVSSGKNSRGDLAVSWWQNAQPNGYVRLARYRLGVWDRDPLRVAGQAPASPNISPVGIDSSGRAQLFFVANRQLPQMQQMPQGGAFEGALWVPWAGENMPSIGQPPLIAANQPVEIPSLLAVADDGGATAMWAGPLDPNSNTYPLFLNALVNDRWGMPQRVANLRARVFAPFPYASNSQGGFVSMALETAANNGTPQVRAFVGRGAQLESASTIVLPEPANAVRDVVIDAAGNALALFTLFDAQQSPHLYSSRYRSAERSWSEARRVSEQVVGRGSLCLLPTGQPVALWFEALAGSSAGQLMLSRFDDAAGWAPPEAIGERFETERQSSIKCAANAQGSLFMTWSQTSTASDGSVSEALLGRRRAPDGSWSEPSRITAITAGFDLSLAALADDDRALVVWRDADPGTEVRSLKWSRSQ